MSWYATGTISLTNGSKTITGSGTAFVANAQPGDGLKAPDGLIYEIDVVGGDTAITLKTNYGGSTASGQTYSIVPTQSRSITLGDSIQTLITNYTTAKSYAENGYHPDGAAATPGISFYNDQDTGFYKYGANQMGFAAGGTHRAILDTNGIGYGVAPTSGDILGLTRSQNSALMATITNANAGAAASSIFRPHNGTTAYGEFGVLGSGYTTSGVLVANRAYASGSHSAGLALVGAAGPVVVAANGTAETARYESGNFLLGTTSAPDGCSVISKSASAGLAAVIQNTHATNGYVLDLKSASAAGTGFTFLRAYANSVLVFNVRGDGNVTNTNNSYGAISERRFKENIRDAGSQWDDLLRASVRKYTMGGVPQIGVVLDEIEKVSPGLVEWSDVVAPVEIMGKRMVPRVVRPAVEASALLKEDGTPHQPARAAVVEMVEEEYVERVENQPTGERVGSVKYSILYMKAVVALQENMRRTMALEAGLAAALKRIEALEARLA